MLWLGDVEIKLKIVWKKYPSEEKLCDGALKYYIMAPSWISMSMSMLLKSRKTFLLTLDPLKQISADLNRANDVLALIQEIVLA